MREEIISILMGHKGRDSAIKGSEITKMVGQRSDREVRIILRDLIAEGLPIASSVTEPYGYFIIETQQERNDYLALTRSRLIENALRRRDFKLASARYLERVIQPSLF